MTKGQNKKIRFNAVSSSSSSSLLFLVAIVASVIAAYFAGNYFLKHTSSLDLLKNSLIDLRMRDQALSMGFLDVAIGYNSNIDLILPAVEMLQEMIQKHGYDIPSPDRAADVETITSFDDLAKSFEYFFRNGSGAERFVSNATLFQQVVEAGTSDRLKSQSIFHIGGNAALMAIKFAREGWKVLLTGAIGPKMKELLAPFPSISFSNEEPTDEYHVIMEYKRNTTWNGAQPPRANRYIVTRDESNAGFVSLGPFHEKIVSTPPKLLVLSGFHLLDGVSDENTRRQRMQAVASKVEQTRKDSKIVITHIELASIGNRQIYEEISHIVFPVIDSLGLNEQELSSLYHVLAAKGAIPNDRPGSLVDQIARTDSDLSSVIHAISYIMSSHRKTLRRVHFHCLMYHLITVVDDEKLDDQALLASISASSLAATEQACDFEPGWNEHDKIELLYDFSTVRQQLMNTVSHYQDRDGVISWRQMQSNKSLKLRFYFAPVMVCKSPRHTVGLGDTISSAGLSQQVRIQMYKERQQQQQQG
jgi:ADP-dependent glucokinase